jgi:membrane-associated phospholipid phosphatase
MTSQGDEACHKRMLALAGLCAVLAILVYLLAVNTVAGQLAGDSAIAGGVARDSRWLRGAATLLNITSLTTLAVATLVIVVIGSIRGGLQLALAAGGAIFGANLATQVLKRGVLIRPALLDAPDPFGSHNSFPSGHATIALSLVLGLLIVLPPSNNLLVAVTGWAYVAATGIAMISEGWHRPSDAVGGYLVATSVASLAAAISFETSRRISGRRPAANFLRDPSHRLSAGVIPLALGLVIITAAVLLAASGGRGWDALDDATFSQAFAMGALFCGASSAWAIAAFLRALSGADLADSGVPADQSVAPARSRRSRS